MENFLSDKRKVGIIVAALIVLGLGIHFYQQSADEKTQAGKNALYQVQKTYEAESAALPEADRAAGANLDVDAKFPKTVSSLNQMLTEKKLPAGVLFEAAFHLGSLYLDHGQTDKAIGVLKQVPDFAKTAFQKASGYYLLGAAQERANQYKEALDSFKEGLSKGIEGMKGEFMLGLVRTNVKLNQKEQAKLYVEKLNKELPGTATAKAAEALVK